MRGRRKKSHQASRHCLHVNMSRAGGEGIALVREASCNIPVSVSIPISTSLYKLSFFSNVPFIKLVTYTFCRVWKLSLRRLDW